MTEQQIEVLIALAVALTALAGAITNFLNHQSNAQAISSLHQRVDAVVQAPAAAPPAIIVNVPPAAPVLPLTGLPDRHATAPATPG